VTLYLDSSALVKLVQREPESLALRRYLRRHQQERRVTSALARVEVVRAVGPAGDKAVAHARRQLSRLHQLAVDADLLDRAALLGAPGVRLRSLDAIHLASAQLLGADLQAVVTYDRHMAQAAVAMDLPVEAPA
jgi:predicted nucleic acid-binding protein